MTMLDPYAMNNADEVDEVARVFKLTHKDESQQTIYGWDILATWSWLEKDKIMSMKLGEIKTRYGIRVERTE